MVLEKTLEIPLDSKEIKSVNPKINQSWIFVGKTDAEAEAPKLATWCKELTHSKRPWCWERLKAGKEGDNRGQMIGWHHWLYGPDFEQAPGVGDGQGGLTSCSPWESQRVRHDWATKLKQLKTVNFCFHGSGTLSQLSWMVLIQDWSGVQSHLEAQLYLCVCVCVCVLNIWCSVARSCPTHCNPKDCSITGSSVLHCLPVSVQYSHSVMSNSLRLHGLQHARLPCPSPTPGAYSNSCP